MEERQPDFDWRAEHDLSRISEEAECFQLGEVLLRLWDGTGPLPKVFKVVENEKGKRVLRRCLVTGEGDSDNFSERYERHIRRVDDLLNEGQAAFDAGAQHHAQWALKAADVVLAELALAMTHFQEGRDDWRGVLDSPRPEYDPRYEVDAELPVGM